MHEEPDARDDMSCSLFIIHEHVYNNLAVGHGCSVESGKCNNPCDVNIAWMLTLDVMIPTSVRTVQLASTVVSKSGYGFKSFGDVKHFSIRP